jgi:hypothetical protein
LAKVEAVLNVEEYNKTHPCPSRGGDKGAKNIVAAMTTNVSDL